MEQRLMKNYNIALDIVKNVIGEKETKQLMRKVEKIGISPRATSRHGVCKYHNGKCTIEISKKMFNFEDDEMITTLIHEILHTFKDTKGHNYKWKWYANKITNNTKYTITRTRNINGDERAEIKYNWKITCLGCGCVWKQQKMTQRVLKGFEEKRRYHRQCGSHEFKVERLGDK